MPYVVQASNWQDASLVNQFDGSKNAADNCGEVAVKMLGRLYGATLDPSPDAIKSYLFGSAASGVVTFDTDLKHALAHFYGIEATTLTPQGQRNGSSGLLDMEWQALRTGTPLIWAGAWVDGNGWIYDGRHTYYQGGQAIHPPLITHWRLVIKQTDTSVTCADPSGGVLMTRSWNDHYALSRGVLVVPTAPPH